MCMSSNSVHTTYITVLDNNMYCTYEFKHAYGCLRILNLTVKLRLKPQE